MIQKTPASNPPYLALDLGERYLGLAFSEAGFLAKELETIDRKNLSDNEVFQKLTDIIQHHQTETLVVGLPVNEDGAENDQCQKIRQFMENFSTFLSNVNGQMSIVSYFPEDFSSFDAKEQLKHQRSKKNRYGDDHSIAARIILENYLESRG